MVEINSAYKHGKYDKISLKSLHVMSIVKVFAMQDGWLAGWLKTTHNTDGHDTFMDHYH